MIKGDRRSRPHTLLMYKRLERFLSQHPGAGYKQIAKHFGIRDRDARRLVDGASTYQQARVYEQPLRPEEDRDPRFFLLPKGAI